MKAQIIFSPRFQLVAKDLKSIALGAVITAASVGSIYFLEALVKIDFGSWTPVVVIVANILINTLRKYTTEKTYVK